MNRQQREALDRHITGNYGEDQFLPEPVEYDQGCPHCGLGVEDHVEKTEEDSYGNDYLILACPQHTIIGNDKAMDHWRKMGCDDLTIGYVLAGGLRVAAYCEACGNDLPPELVL